MLKLGVSTVFFAEQHTTHAWWQRMRPRLTILYLVVALLLVLISGAGHLRLFGEFGKVFGGFSWAIDGDDPDGPIVLITIPPQLPPFAIPTGSLTRNTHIIEANKQPGAIGIQHVYQQANPGDIVTYTAKSDQATTMTFTRPTSVFTWDLWLQTFGLASLAGASWLIVGFVLLATATEWTGAVEGLTLLPPAMLLLLYSHWGNIQTATPPDLIVQMVWIPCFALLGAAFIHLSLTYRPSAMMKGRQPSWLVDGLPYAPLLLLIAYEWISFLSTGHVPIRTNIVLSLAYAVLGGVVSLSIGVTSILQMLNIWPARKRHQLAAQTQIIPSRIRHHLGDLLTLWIGGIGLGFCFGVLPILLTGKILLPLSIFYTLAAVYPLILLYAIRSLRLIARLHVTIDQREEALQEQQRTAQILQKTNEELTHATELLLHADAHLRSLLSQRIHDQPKQQALRIRSLLGYWQHKLRLEMERTTDRKVAAPQVIEALGKVRKISEELERDLHGLQLLVEDAYQRRSLGLKLHLEKLVREDLPMLHPESSLEIQADLWALDALSSDLEQTETGEKIAEAISYTVTQALLNIYNHAGASFATIRTTCQENILKVEISDDGHGFDVNTIPPEKTSMFKAELKVRAAHGTLQIKSFPGTGSNHGTTILLELPLPPEVQLPITQPQPDYREQYR
ncbi:hypothetical protein KDA_07010 [Dictyobacter alpinus]|uniref:Histidine kinase/HSP90-like ATPase domain-containing protein n=1 Tax=Dictyobacter alpinus TaxID=2014873 RepID=A0A402B1P0_9CHLR|nr:hypothetical protein [Dictyobacter alpinus]GCE25217.1 hypothetical protein KDA_07010 [Dictyobacter alpinus]